MPFFPLLQLPPVCRHNKQDPEKTCQECHVTSSTCWQYVVRHELAHSERHCEDPEFSNFLALVRKERPTQKQIDDALTACSISEDEVIELADEDAKVLCSHNEQVTIYNTLLLHDFFPPMPDDAITISAHMANPTGSCIWEDLPLVVQTWATNPTQHELQRAALMLRVMLTELAFPAAASALYGAMARIVELHNGGDTTCGIEAISLQLDSDQSIHRFHRSVVHSQKHDGVVYSLSTFPLRPCTVVSTPLSTNAEGVAELEQWLDADGKDFHALQEIAVGARAMVNKNISLPKGVSNGAPCVVRDIQINPDGSVKAITVQMESNGHMQKVTRSSTHQRCHDGKQ